MALHGFGDILPLLIPVLAVCGFFALFLALAKTVRRIKARREGQATTGNFALDWLKWTLCLAAIPVGFGILVFLWQHTLAPRILR